MRYVSQKEIDKLIENGRILIFRNYNIYDITDFINIHPGGKECIIRKHLTNCEYDYNFHSNKAKILWKRYLIGHKHKYPCLKKILHIFCCKSIR